MNTKKSNPVKADLTQDFEGTTATFALEGRSIANPECEHMQSIRVEYECQNEIDNVRIIQRVQNTQALI